MFGRWRERRTEALFRKVVAAREAERARVRRPLSGLSPLVRELVQIGERGGFLGQDRKRTEAIGGLLNQEGGKSAMLAAHEQVAAWVPYQARGLEMAWDGIGDWYG